MHGVSLLGREGSRVDALGSARGFEAAGHGFQVGRQYGRLWVASAGSR